MMKNKTASLEGGVAIVTGAAGPIGRAIAVKLAEEGAAVLAADIAAEGAETTAKAIRDAGGRAMGVRTDVTDAASVKAAVTRAVAEWGRLDYVVNNAAVQTFDPFDTLKRETVQRVMAVNFEGSLLLIQAATPYLEKGGRGAVVNIVSVMGYRGGPGAIPYSTSKAALVNLTRCLACDLAPRGIRVNAVAPGFIHSGMSILPGGQLEYTTDWYQEVYIKHGRIPMRRNGEPGEIAAPVAFLCSSGASFITGEILTVDGGMAATF